MLWKPIKFRNRYLVAGWSWDAAGNARVELFQSKNGLNWVKKGKIAGGSETFLQPIATDKLKAFVRTEKPPYHLWFYESVFPFRAWHKTGEIPGIIQAPHIVEIRGAVYLIGRERPDYLQTADRNKPSFARHRTKIWRVKKDDLVEVLELPSKGDNSYAGTAVRPDGSILISYYSQHETGKGDTFDKEMPADIFVACIAPESFEQKKNKSKARHCQRKGGVRGARRNRRQAI